MDGDTLLTFFSEVKCLFFFAGKQTLKVFDGDDAVKRNQFRSVSIPRIIKNEEVVVRALSFFPCNTSLFSVLQVSTSTTDKTFNNKMFAEHVSVLLTMWNCDE